MSVQPGLAPVPFRVFADTMARLVAGVAVVTSRHEGGKPCGLLVSSLCSYSANPPSLLVAIGQERASYRPLIGCVEFGVHLLGADQQDVAAVFASRRDDKFAMVDWRWDNDVPHLVAAPVFVTCLRRAVHHHGDHAIVIGEVARARSRPAEPLVYYGRRLDWRLR